MGFFFALTGLIVPVLQFVVVTVVVLVSVFVVVLVLLSVAMLVLVLVFLVLSPLPMFCLPLEKELLVQWRPLIMQSLADVGFI